MGRKLLIPVLFVVLGSGCAEPEKPNIIYILADDLGYGELGCYGQEIIETPHLDALAQGGMRFISHYSGAPVCAPARCILMTGKHAGHAHVRGNDEWGSRGLVWDYQAMFDDPFLEGQRPIPDSIFTLAEMLGENGYHTGMVGKWGLGAPTTEGIPNRQGFDFFLGYNCQRQAHTLFPMHLWRNEERLMLDNKFVPLHANLPEDADPHDPKSYSDFHLNEYAPTVMHEGALNFIEKNQDEPFFLYYASPLPHVPLQAPMHWVEYYRKKIGAEEPHIAKSYFPNLTPRATYAAMISYLDEQVGDLVAKLKELGIYENTLILFSSDNGPSYTGGADPEYFRSASPFDSKYGRTKGWVYEGGIRVPMIAHWPGHVTANSTTNHVSAFYDVMPTLAELIGLPQLTDSDGISFAPTLLGADQQKHAYLYWEFPAYGGQQAVRMGNWKGIRTGLGQGQMSVSLYDLSHDSLELNDLAEQYPEISSKIEDIMQNARTEPTVDRFRLEALGDKLEAKTRAESRLALLPNNFEVKVAPDQYFRLSNRTSLNFPVLAAKSIESLQQRLLATGGYQLRESTTSGNEIDFYYSTDFAGDSFHMMISPDQVAVEAGEAAGFAQAVQTLISLFDPQILEDHRMHNPTWWLAGGEIYNK